jgi:DNA-binding response OmpR family regulator
LVIEDEKYLRELYVEILADEGFSVASASDGEEGLNAINAGGYDLILLDIMLPKLDGLKILEAVQKNPPVNMSGNIIVLSNLGQDSVVAAALALGAKGYMIKSDYTPDQVVNEVKNFLKNN